MSTEPEWATVLRVLYREGATLAASNRAVSGGATPSESDQVDGDGHDGELVMAQYGRIGEETGLSEGEIADVVEWLDDNGLVRRADQPVDDGDRERYPVELTPTGFEVAQEQVRHEREAEQGLERNRLQHSFNRAIALLTLGLVTINMFDSAIRITLETDRLAVAYIVLALGFGGMIVVLAGVIYSGLLSSYSNSEA